MCLVSVSLPGGGDDQVGEARRLTEGHKSRIQVSLRVFLTKLQQK